MLLKEMFVKFELINLCKVQHIGKMLWKYTFRLFLCLLYYNLNQNFITHSVFNWVGLFTSATQNIWVSDYSFIDTKKIFLIYHHLSREITLA